MLKTNSKKAHENIRAYIIANYDPTNYELPETKNFSEIAANIYTTFQSEKYYGFEYIRAKRIPEFTLFEEWASGLPSIIDTCYYYNRSAVDDLGEILEETASEKKRYTEREAESFLTRLIYNEIKKEV
jgi:hypothetical protein